MAVDDRLQNTVSFGGQARDGLSGITLVYDNSSNGTWWYAGSAISPPARSNATFASYPPGDLAVLFGGLGNLAPARTYRDTWAYYFYNETWVNISQTSGPPARENAAMAVDPTDGLALLFGGMDPAYSSGGATGTAVWNDTWELNLTTFTWSPLVLGSSPPALLGSSMVWDPVTAEFVLFGGCDTSHCSDTVYTYVPGQRAWSLRSVGGAVPSGRGSASFAWDPVDNGSILFGGFAPGPAGPTALGDTYYLSPTVSSWSTIPSQGGPPPTYGAASTFSDYPGCVGFWVQGGSPALESIIYNDSLLEPVTSLRPNCFTPFGGGTGGGPPPPCSNTSAHVTVQVRDALTGRGVGGSDVIVSGSCGTSHGITGVDGFVNLTEAAPDILNVRADAVGYHGQNLTVTYTGAPGAVVRVDLNPLPSLSARIFGASLTGRVPLPNATVTVNAALIVGRSNALGWVNASRVPDSTPVLVVSGSATDFGPGSVTVAYPYTGVVYANLTLSAFGALTVRVRDNQTGAPIAGATIDLRFIDPVGANTSVVFSGADGNYSSALEAGNYSYTVSETGYFSNSSSAPVYHPWIAPTFVEVNLSRVYGADVDVHVVDSTTGNPVALATVTLGGSRTVATDVRGWANVSNVQPPGLVRIDVSAWGFYPNSTTVTIGP
ncbi:MAG TPA: carboxypeptidase regulatory-like domain-containing protein [Thermoplasmata archaeon]|nr:carboxypeptidase regulatory-like domain-containing protein [Thermoplasmata archaeon]